MIKSGEYYTEEVEEGFGVFNTDDVGRFKSGFCFALYTTEKEAEDKAVELNKRGDNMIKVKNNESGKELVFETLTEAIEYQEYLVFVLGIDAEIL